MELINNPTKLETAIFNWFTQNYPELANQINKAEVIRREYSGVGFFIHLDVPNNLQPVYFDKNPISGPLIKSEEIPLGGEAICFMKDGYISMLEIYTFGDEFPKNIKSFRLGG